MTPHKTTSPYNDRHTTIGPATKVSLNDCTLREGEQSAIVNFQPEQKLDIARRLVDAGIDRIQVGYSGLSQTDWTTIRTLRDAGLPTDLESVVLSYLDSWSEQIDAAASSGATVANIVHVTSPPRREQVFRVTPDQIRTRTADAIRAAKAHGLYVTYSPADTTRTELDFALDLIRIAERAGADRIAVADTLGAATPGAIRYLVEQVRQATSCQIAIHVHNDFGLAIANALAGVEAGAEVIDTTLNGWGDRTGNPPTEEVATALQLLYGALPEVDVVALAALAKDTAAALGVAVPPTKPVTGEVAFAHKLETHVKAVLQHPPAFEAYDPVLVGGRRHVAIGQYSGPEAIGSRLRAIGLAFEGDAMARFIAEVQRVARTTNRVLTDDDLRAIAERLETT